MVSSLPMFLVLQEVRLPTAVTPCMQGRCVLASILMCLCVSVSVCVCVFQAEQLAICSVHTLLHEQPEYRWGNVSAPGIFLGRNARNEHFTKQPRSTFLNVHSYRSLL